MMTDYAIPIRSDVAWRNIDGNAIIVQPKEGYIYPLNSVATKIWLFSDGTRRVSDIIESLVEEFDGSEEEIRKDALRFLEELTSASLIQIAEKETAHATKER